MVVCVLRALVLGYEDPAQAQAQAQVQAQAQAQAQGDSGSVGGLSKVAMAGVGGVPPSPLYVLAHEHPLVLNAAVKVISSFHSFLDADPSLPLLGHALGLVVR